MAGQISAELWEVAVGASRIPDKAGKLPGQPGYTPTYDPHWLAAEAVELAAVHQAAGGELQEFDSEGARFKFTPPDLHALAQHLRAKSLIGRLNRHRQAVLSVDGRLADYTPTSGRSHDTRVARLGNGALVPKELDWT